MSIHDDVAERLIFDTVFILESIESRMMTDRYIRERYL
jgi:hypothetical protein